LIACSAVGGAKTPEKQKATKRGKVAKNDRKRATITESPQKKVTGKKPDWKKKETGGLEGEKTQPQEGEHDWLGQKKGKNKGGGGHRSGGEK